MFCFKIYCAITPISSVELDVNSEELRRFVEALQKEVVGEVIRLFFTMQHVKVHTILSLK